MYQIHKKFYHTRGINETSYFQKVIEPAQALEVMCLECYAYIGKKEEND